MRYATWLKIEASPFWYRVFGYYSKLPAWVRAALRFVALPHWQIAGWLVRIASRHRVVAGPFAGMKLELSPLSRRHHLGYVLGSQEIELWEVIERIALRGYRTILNAGAADAYYAVGLALRCPDAGIEAYEALSALQPVIRRTAASNGVAQRVVVSGCCDAATLRLAVDRAQRPVLLLMDIEGGEFTLLDPVAVSQLRHVDILVETHDPLVPGSTAALIDRFCATHDIERYRTRPRVIADFPNGFLPGFKRWFPRLAVDLMNERRRGDQQWLYMTDKNG